MEDVFKIKTVNHTYGEVYVNAPLDRESVDRYLLKVRQELHAFKIIVTTYLYCHTILALIFLTYAITPPLLTKREL